jgi:hypothetical protein
LRNHPAINWFRSGIPIVFGSDDAGTTGLNEFTLDFYLAYMAWGLTLADLKQIALNSIKHSLINEETKAEGLRKFTQAWTEFIDTFNETTSCTQQTGQFNITNILPQIGPYNITNKLTIYGYGFEFAICEPVYCLFDSVQQPARIERIGEIVCETPVMTRANSSSRISLKYGSNVIETNFSFRFLTLEELATPDDDKQEPNSTHHLLNPFKSIRFLLAYLIFTISLINFFD